VGAQEIVIVLVVLALIFGASRLPTLARNMGLGIKEFRKGIKEVREDETDADTGTDTGSGTTGGSSAAPSQNGTGASDDVPAKRRD
jgi:sec-independent protein translocase protein TatA